MLCTVPVGRRITLHEMLRRAMLNAFECSETISRSYAGGDSFPRTESSGPRPRRLYSGVVVHSHEGNEPKSITSCSAVSSDNSPIIRKSVQILIHV